MGYGRNVKFGRQSDFFVLYKKPQNNFFLPGPFQCANISQIFHKYFHLLDHHKIFGASFYRSHSTRPTIFFTSFLQPAGIATDSFENRSSAYGRVQLVPKYISKVKLNRGYSPNILSEIMRFQENGSRGKHFAQFP